MSDISKCNWEKCPVKNICRRFKCKINPYRQTWTKWDYVEWTGCDLFLEDNVWQNSAATKVVKS